jgi:hypothetical protein
LFIGVLSIAVPLGDIRAHDPYFPIDRTWIDTFIEQCLDSIGKCLSLSFECIIEVDVSSYLELGKLEHYHAPYARAHEKRTAQLDTVIKKHRKMKLPFSMDSFMLLYRS